MSSIKRGRRIIVRCGAWESGAMDSRSTAERRAALNDSDPYCEHTDHQVIEQEWKDGRWVDVIS